MNHSINSLEVKQTAPPKSRTNSLARWSLIPGPAAVIMGIIALYMPGQKMEAEWAAALIGIILGAGIAAAAYSEVFSGWGIYFFNGAITETRL